MVSWATGLGMVSGRYMIGLWGAISQTTPEPGPLSTLLLPSLPGPREAGEPAQLSHPSVVKWPLE